MKYDEYLDRIRELFIEFDQRKTLLNQEFADSNNPHGVGDIIEDHMGFVQVVKIGNYDKDANGRPYSTYYGRELKKDKTPTKREKFRWVHQINLLDFNGKEGGGK